MKTGKQGGKLTKGQKQTVIIAGICAVLVIAVAVIYAVRASKADRPGVDDYAVSRSPEDEGDIHYFDDEAIPLAGTLTDPGAMAEAEAVLAHVNAMRANAGLGALTWDNSLSQAAMVRAVECESAFSHTRPNGTAWWTVNSMIMYGENLAKNYFNAATVVQAWMASPTHAANILGNFSTIGVAAYIADNGTWYWAQEFGY